MRAATRATFRWEPLSERPSWTPEQAEDAATYGICPLCGEPRKPLSMQRHGDERTNALERRSEPQG